MSTVEKKLEDLFQEGLSLFNTDPKPSRGIAWVDNMYQKLEVMCKGVDENKFLQETSKFVENQVQSVGVNVRKFCAEFVHELLTSPSDCQVKIGPLTDLSLTYGEVIENHGKMKEGLEKFCPLDDELPEPKELQDGSDFGEDLQDDSSLDGNQVNFSSGGACDEAQNDAPSQPQVRCGHNSEGGNDPDQPLDASQCSNLVQDCPLLRSSTPLDRLFEKDTSQGNASNAVVASSSSKAGTSTSPSVEHMVDVASDNTKRQQQSVLPQDFQLSADSEFTVIPASIDGDEATECNQKTGVRKFLSFRASENGKRLAQRSAKVVHTASVSTDKTCLHKSAEDDDYEQVAYWYVNIDSESKHSKGISPINLVDDNHMRRSVSVDNCESDWEFL
ncbi:uncharacterized protein LOC116258111 [Nymphaea colorata]|nr:uncharacterized protein LOC116258111 [Nymphaea colorata]XP_031491103.1 uncharacterized protein LOC116258111 [Nymphaea colorata]XP_031491111.1 uncharacterized protein LOC116258111 [Nymphaea colorata]XP_031491118.1 uncharacterized protein LOC116258111 [Nymphaea colorata]XP_031491127.1 uncharacterized protein LOC116258111 [Nymphaea colorata]XP_031491136.1 uncharacterized protein LOC116258111 [Nymphaea colorata]XP_031491143.1 uncharacterized protein LOC116258111 [Nymphaea colorata]XP_03149115